MATLLSYDISNKHREFKDEMELLGYTKTVPGNPHKINLPNTTLSHPTRTAPQARDDARTTATKLNVTLQRCIAIEYDSYAGILGDPYDI